jgi:hypothetical protein
MPWVRLGSEQQWPLGSTEISDIVGISVNLAGELLKALEEQGLLVAGRQIRPGRGFFYMPAWTDDD